MADREINPLVKLIQERLPWLFEDYSFKIVTYSYDPRSFGNCLVVLESPALRLRFVRDRSITSAELAARSEPDTWYDVGSLLSFLQGERPDAAFEGLAVLLKQNWKALDSALGPNLAETREQEMHRRDEVMKTLEEYQREFQRKMKR